MARFQSSFQFLQVLLLLGFLLNLLNQKMPRKKLKISLRIDMGKEFQ